MENQSTWMIIVNVLVAIANALIAILKSQKPDPGPIDPPTVRQD